MSTFIKQGCMKLNKSDSKNHVQNFLFQINAVLLNILFMKKP